MVLDVEACEEKRDRNPLDDELSARRAEGVIFRKNEVSPGFPSYHPASILEYQTTIRPPTFEPVQ
jgi:hypothetical protein